VPALPDLTDSIVAAPATLPLGQYINITYTINNNGAGGIFPYVVRNAVYLSSDFIAGNAGDILLGYEDRNGTVDAGQSLYKQTVARM
jgi:hypothetical protein